MRGCPKGGLCRRPAKRTSKHDRPDTTGPHTGLRRASTDSRSASLPSAPNGLRSNGCDDTQRHCWPVWPTRSGAALALGSEVAALHPAVPALHPCGVRVNPPCTPAVPLPCILAVSAFHPSGICRTISKTTTLQP